MHCKYLSVVPYRALEKFAKALYGITGGTYSARVFRPVMRKHWLVTVDYKRLAMSTLGLYPLSYVVRRWQMARFGGPDANLPGKAKLIRSYP